MQDIDKKLDIENFLGTVFLHSKFLKNYFLNKKISKKTILQKLLEKRTEDAIYNDLNSIDYMNLTEFEFLKFLRDAKYFEYLLIAIEDICLNRSVYDVTYHISTFAKAILEVAYKYAYKTLTEIYGIPVGDNGNEIGFCIVALGKFGGWELNFSSDIDIIYVYDTEFGTCVKDDPKSEITVHEFFCKLGEKIKFLLNERTENGIVFRVDLRLRPDGEKGDIALPVHSYELYYETFGQSWERMMLLKALPVVGDMKVGEKFLNVIKPFVFRRTLDTKLIDELISIKSKINARVKLQKKEKNVKLGFGGIREIEFIVQATQILNYPKDKGVFHRNTLISLEVFKEKKLLLDEDADKLIESYNFLRKLEHMAQVEMELQTHCVPEHSESYDLYLKRCGFKERYEFEKKYFEITKSVNEIFNKILSADRKESDETFLFDEELTFSDRVYILKEKGIKDPEFCAEILDRIIEGKSSKKRSAKDKEMLKKVMAFIISELFFIKDPVGTLLNFEKFFSNSTSIYLFYDIFRESKNFLKKLVNIFYLSPYLSMTIIKNNNVLDYIYDPKSYSYSEDELCRQFYQIAEKAGYMEYEYELIRKTHQELLFNLGYGYINKDINVIELTKNLTYLADATICLAINRGLQELVQRYGTPQLDGKFCDFLFIGVGKLGSYEMSFGSDLDLIVIYEGAGFTDGKNRITSGEFYSKLVQRVISYLSTQTVFGYLYKIDMRLRPSGSSGTLVTTLSSFREYQEKKAMLWEKQSFLRARVINKDSTLLKEFMKIKNDTLFSGSISDVDVQEIYDMRMKIESEKGAPFTKNDIKSGYGGIIDIEFAVQMLQLRYGHVFNEIRYTNTHDMLHGLKQLKIIKLRDFYALHNSYLFYRNLENLIRVYKNTSSSTLPKDNETLEKLSTFFGYKKNGAESLKNEYLSVRKVVRAAFNRLFGKSQ
jgi:glutamate-ammonia-ligase adenylyltransferase